jgi:CRP/FNR family transcriptional regulator, cyclic AMP receptor protein
MHSDEQRDIQRLLRTGEWFCSLPDALQQLILSRSTVRKFAKGQVISLEDSVPKGLFAVLEGLVHFVRDVGSGDEALLHVAEPGYWFGEFAVLTGQPTVVTALAHSPVRALLLSRLQFDRILAEDPRYFQAFASLALDRYGLLIRVFAELRDLAPEARVRGRLAAMVQVRKQDQPTGGPVSLAVSQGNLARMVGVSRQTLNAILGKLHREGLVEIGIRRIRVLDAARLTAPREELEPAAPMSTNARRRVPTHAPST